MKAAVTFEGVPAPGIRLHPGDQPGVPELIQTKRDTGVLEGVRQRLGDWLNDLPLLQVANHPILDRPGATLRGQFPDARAAADLAEVLPVFPEILRRNSDSEN